MKPPPADADAISTVVIVGGGTAGWMSAAALAKLLGKRLSIRLVESDVIGTIGVGEATIPPIKNFNRLLGLDEADLLAATQGTFKLGIEFEGWSRPGARYMHAFGPIGQNLGWLRTHQYWLKAKSLGKASDFAAYSINAVAARRNRFMPPQPDASASPLKDVVYAYHFDASLYARYLRGFAEARGVVRTEGRVVGVDQNGETGFVQAVVLESGERVEGDLFLDCSGLRGLLIEQTLKSGFEDWSHWLPCDRALAVPSASVEPLTPYTRSTARASGWQWRIPLQHRIGNGLVYSSAFISDEDAARELLTGLDSEPLGDPRPVRFTTGKRKRQWNRNVVAVGLSGGFLEPLESTSIHLIQSALLKLVQLFPDKAFRQADIDEFNAQSDLEYTNLRDFIIAHYKLGERTDTPFWRYCRNVQIPDSLQRKLSTFASAARTFRQGDELFDVESWIQVLLGQDLMPSAWDPGVELYSDDEILAYLQNIEEVIQKCVDVMPDHAEYVRRTCKASAVAA
jgi:tryptophan halogenase